MDGDQDQEQHPDAMTEQHSRGSPPHARPPRALRRTARAGAPGARRGPRRCHARHGRALGGVPRAVPRAGARRPRPRPGGARASPGSGSPASATGSTSCTPSTTRSPMRSHELGFRRDRRHPVRPRCLLAAARPGRTRLLLLEGCPARHAHGLDERADGGDDPRHLQRGRPAAHLPRLRRGEAGAAVRAPHRRGAGRSIRSSARRSSST